MPESLNKIKQLFITYKFLGPPPLLKKIFLNFDRFLQIYRNKRAQQRNFYAYIFSEQLFGENICLKFPVLGSFLVID